MLIPDKHALSGVEGSLNREDREARGERKIGLYVFIIQSVIDMVLFSVNSYLRHKAFSAVKKREF